LAARGIGVDEVRQRWPELHAAQPALADRAAHLAPAVSDALQAAELRLADYVRPVELATEHLLLGLAVGQNAVADWFAERGLDIPALEAEIHCLGGHLPGPESVEPVEVDDVVGDDRPSDSLATERTAVWRILDAAANRAGEGLRVIEDYARFALDDRFLTAQCKSLRHELTAALAVFPLALRHAARETRGDVGTHVSLASEQARGGARHVVAAGFQRVQQALRSLEEYAKTVEPAAAVQFESLRYRAYTLQRAVDITADSTARLADVRLYVLIDGHESAQRFDQFVAALVAAGVDVIQLRDKHLSDRELIARARLLRERTRGTQTLFIANDRPDVAILSQADGVHVGQEELSVKDVRAIVGPGMLVGVSTHSLEQARAAVLDGADYIGVGPTFPSRTKEFSHFPGLDLLKQVVGEIRLPAFAVGGITAANVAQVRACGMTRIAVAGAVTDGADPAAAVAELRRLLG
jgi:thiamine-phosphate pyrophosphorylase